MGIVVVLYGIAPKTVFSWLKRYVESLGKRSFPTTEVLFGDESKDATDSSWFRRPYLPYPEWRYRVMINFFFPDSDFDYSSIDPHRGFDFQHPNQIDCAIIPVDDPSGAEVELRVDYSGARVEEYYQMVLHGIAEHWPETEDQLKKQGADVAPRPAWFPTTAARLEIWRKSYQVIQKTRKIYINEYEEGKTDEPNPSKADLQDALAMEPYWKSKPGERTVERIMKAGDYGWLD